MVFSAGEGIAWGNPPCPSKFLDKRITRRPVIQARSRLSSQGHAGMTLEVGEKPMMALRNVT